MEEHKDANAVHEQATASSQDAINREKGRKMDAPRNVAEQVDQLADDDGSGHRRRDPVAGAAEQRRDDAEV